MKLRESLQRARVEERERGREGEADWYFHRGTQSKVCLRGFLLALRLKVPWKLNNGSSIGVIYDSREKIIGTVIYS